MNIIKFTPFLFHYLYSFFLTFLDFNSRECAEIQASKDQWTSDVSRAFFDDLVEVYQAFLTLCISHLPEAIMMFLTWFGFDSDRDKAINRLIMVIDRGNGIWCLVSKIAFSFYECLVIQTFGARPPNIDKLLEITNQELSKDERVKLNFIFDWKISKNQLTQNKN